VNVETTLTEEGEKAFGEINAPSPTCFKCTHQPICIVFRSCNQFISQTFDDRNRPVKPDDLAKICTLYTLDSKFISRQ